MQKVTKERKYFGIIADETADVSSQEQLTVCLRTVSDNFDVEETFFGMYSLDRCDSPTIFRSIEDVLLRLNLCFDGAAAYQGETIRVAN